MSSSFILGNISGLALGIFIALEWKKPWALLLVVAYGIAKYIIQKVLSFMFEDELKRAQKYQRAHPIVYTLWRHARLFGKHDPLHLGRSPLKCTNCQIIK